MSVRRGQGGVCGGRGGRGSRGRNRGSGQYTATLNKNKGLCSALGNNVFNYGQEGAVDQMWTTWEKIVHHAGTIYGHNIRSEMQNKMKVFIPNPEYTEDVQSKHKPRMELLNIQSARLRKER